MENNLQNEQVVVEKTTPAKTQEKETDEDVAHFLLLTGLSIIVGVAIALVSIFAFSAQVVVGIIVGVVGALFAFEIFFSEKIRELICAGFEKTLDLPGIIFDLDIDGILFYILYKWIVAPILSLLVAILFGLGAILLSFIISPFFFPFTLGSKISDLAG